MSGSDRVGFDNGDVLYMLMPDRFSRGRRGNGAFRQMRDGQCDRRRPQLRHGGDLEGIRRHLDYFCDLGVTALWLTPVLENDSPARGDSGEVSTYHGYAVTDFYRVDPRLGSNDDYCRLVSEAHAKGLKVVMDMIFNHCSIDHPWMTDAPLTTWINRRGECGHLQTNYKLTTVMDPYAADVDRAETVEGWFVETMPDLNQRNPHVRRYLMQNSMWWIETAGINGIRMDTYPYADRQAMAWWMERINAEYPEFNTVGETWVTETAYTAAWQKDSGLAGPDSNLKTVMDFALYDHIGLAMTEETDGWWSGLNRVYNTLVYDYLYRRPENVMAFLDNHDTDRFLSHGRGVAELKQALAILLTIRRTPQIYYGTEILMHGTTARTDADVRCDFPGGFPGDRRDAFTSSGRTSAQRGMYGWLRRVLHWRRGSQAVRYGRQKHFLPHEGVYVIARMYVPETVVTVLNGTSEWRRVSLGRYGEVLGGWRSATDITTGRRVDLSGGELVLRPRQSMILVTQRV